MAEIFITALFSFPEQSAHLAKIRPGVQHKRLLLPPSDSLFLNPISARMPSSSDHAFEAIWSTRSRRLCFYPTMPAAKVAQTGNHSALMTTSAVKSLALLAGPAPLPLGRTPQAAAGVATPPQSLAEVRQRTPLSMMATNPAAATPTHMRGLPWAPQLVLPALTIAVSQVHF